MIASIHNCKALYSYINSGGSYAVDSEVHAKQNFRPLVKSESYFPLELSRETAPASMYLSILEKEIWMRIGNIVCL